jgi:DNA-binding CsgD family transcriptional regulator/tetratricopeptide (TPR) repeat protein
VQSSPVGLEDARAAAAAGRWTVAYQYLQDVDVGSLDGAGLELYADAAWWTLHLDESLTLRQRAHRSFVDEHAPARAAMAAWFLHFDYLWWKGNEALASGWLARAVRLLTGLPECVEHGYLSFAQANGARELGDLDAADRFGHEALAVARRHGDVDLTALAVQELGQVLVARGQITEGIALMDEAMCAAVNGELQPQYAGWVLCSVLLACFAVADLKRAAEWTEAAVAWCDSQESSTPYHGLCRVHRVEVSTLRGAWADAVRQGERAIEELLALDPVVAGDAFYVSGELHRRRGDMAAAEAAFMGAHELGRDPNPGLALVRLARGRPDDAAAGMRAPLEHELGPPLTRARLLDAHVQISLARDDPEAARIALEELDQLAGGRESSVLGATAQLARASIDLHGGHHEAAAHPARRAVELFRDLKMPYEAALARVLVGRACRALGDVSGAGIELRSACRELEALGATFDLEQARAFAGPSHGAPASLSPREIEVLRLLAAGRTNPEIAEELNLSRHTISRHVQNIFAKLGVSSRAAAATFAAQHELV